MGLRAAHQCLRESAAACARHAADSSFQAATLELLQHHHEREDEVVFPALARHLPASAWAAFARLEEQHEQLHAALTQRPVPWELLSRLLHEHMELEERCVLNEATLSRVDASVLRGIEARLGGSPQHAWLVVQQAEPWRFRLLQEYMPLLVRAARAFRPHARWASYVAHFKPASAL